VHIQHVIDDSQNRTVVRFIWSCIQSFINFTQSIFIVTDRKIWIPKELEDKNIKRYIEIEYVPRGDPDCVFLHNVESSSIRALDVPSISFQTARQMPPVFGTRVVSLSKWVDRFVRADIVLKVTGQSGSILENSEFTIGFICDYDKDVNNEVADLIRGIGTVIPHARIILPTGTEAFRGRIANKIKNQIDYVDSTERLAPRCDVAIFPWSVDSCDQVGDTVATAMINKCVPIVGHHGASKEYVPDSSFVFHTAHQAVKMCWRLAFEHGFLEHAMQKCLRHYMANFTMDDFRKSLVRELSTVVKVG